MNLKEIFFICVVFALLVGSVCAAKDVNDFKIDKSYNGAYNGSYYSLYLNGKQDAGIVIFKNVDDDAYDDIENDDAYDHLIHDDGREYTHADDDFKLDKNADNTCNFTDYEHAEHGIVEVVNSGGEQYIVVFWAKDNGSVNNSDLTSLLTQFNKDNDVQAVAF